MYHHERKIDLILLYFQILIIIYTLGTTMKISSQYRHLLIYCVKLFYLFSTTTNIYITSFPPIN